MHDSNPNVKRTAGQLLGDSIKKNPYGFIFGLMAGTYYFATNQMFVNDRNAEHYQKQMEIQKQINIDKKAKNEILPYITPETQDKVAKHYDIPQESMNPGLAAELIAKQQIADKTIKKEVHDKINHDKWVNSIKEVEHDSPW